jgi:hypothetical protein
MPVRLGRRPAPDATATMRPQPACRRCVGARAARHHRQRGGAGADPDQSGHPRAMGGLRRGPHSRPPSTARICPVIHPACSLARNRAAEAMSSAWDGRQRVLDGLHTRRLGQAEDIASAALFLASEQAGWITGPGEGIPRLILKGFFSEQLGRKRGEENAHRPPPSQPPARGRPAAGARRTPHPPARPSRGHRLRRPVPRQRAGIFLRTTRPQAGRGERTPPAALTAARHPPPGSARLLESSAGSPLPGGRGVGAIEDRARVARPPQRP